MVFSSRRMKVLLVLVLALSIQSCAAKNDDTGNNNKNNNKDDKKNDKKKKNTDSPTISPSLFPSESPTVAPTMSPTDFPTSTGTASPTASPTVETNSATLSPTLATSRATTTESPLSVTAVPLPFFGIDILLSDDDGSSRTVADLEQDLTSFIEDVVQISDGVDTLDSITLDFEVVLSSFQRRKLETGLSIAMEGVAYYGSGAPTPEDLNDNIRQYFATFGIQDLEMYLEVIGLTSSKVISVSVGDDTIIATDPSLGFNTGATVENPQVETKDGQVLSTGVFAGVIAVGVVCLLSFVYFVVHYCSKSDYSDWLVDDRVAEGGATPPKESRIMTVQTSSEEMDPEDEESAKSPSNRSEDMSLYTSGTSVHQASVKSHSYDVNRLDKVIEVARKHSEVQQRPREE